MQRALALPGGETAAVSDKNGTRRVSAGELPKVR